MRLERPGLESRVAREDNSLRERAAMKITRLATSAVLAAGIVFLLAIPGTSRADSTTHGSPEAPKATSDTAQKTRDTAAAGESDVAGLDLTEDQKAQFAKIHEGMETRKALVAKDT